MKYNDDDQIAHYTDAYRMRIDHLDHCKAVLQKELDKKFGCGKYSVSYSSQSIPHELSVQAFHYELRLSFSTKLRRGSVLFVPDSPYIDDYNPEFEINVDVAKELSELLLKLEVDDDLYRLAVRTPCSLCSKRVAEMCEFYKSDFECMFVDNCGNCDLDRHMNITQ